MAGVLTGGRRDSWYLRRQQPDTIWGGRDVLLTSPPAPPGVQYFPAQRERPATLRLHQFDETAQLANLLAPVAAAAPFMPIDYPNPAKRLARAQTYREGSEAALLTEVAEAPIIALIPDTPARAPKRWQPEAAASLLALGPLVGLTPFTQLDWPNPPPRPRLREHPQWLQAGFVTLLSPPLLTGVPLTLFTFLPMAGSLEGELDMAGTLAAGLAMAGNLSGVVEMH